MWVRCDKQQGIRLQLGHAGEGVEISPSGDYLALGSSCFNWATPVKAWRLEDDYIPPVVKGLLQLGHAGEGVEMCMRWTPRSSGVVLQLGHAGEGVEIRTGSFWHWLQCLLQLGHAGEGVEIGTLVR